MPALIEASSLVKLFGKHPAVDGVDLNIQAGEVYALLGPDGAGKTTTLRLLCGALRPTPGKGIPATVRIAGIDLLRHPEQARARLGYLPQRFSLYEDLTVLENLRFFAEARGLPASAWRPRCLDILKFVGLDEFQHRRAGQLSGGMRQKLGLAAALINRPQVLLLDEPTTGVDPVTRQDFWQLIIHLLKEGNDQDRGAAVLVSTPYMDEAARCSRVGFMRQGRLILEGSPASLRQRLAGQVLELAGADLTALRPQAQADPDVMDVQRFGDRLHLRVKPGAGERVVQRLGQHLAEHNLVDVHLQVVEPGLEDVFLSLLEVEE